MFIIPIRQRILYYSFPKGFPYSSSPTEDLFCSDARLRKTTGAKGFLAGTHTQGSLGGRHGTSGVYIYIYIYIYNNTTNNATNGNNTYNITVGLRRRLGVVSPALLRRVPWQILEDQPACAPTMCAGAQAAHATAVRQDRSALCRLDHGSSMWGSSTAAAAACEGSSTDAVPFRFIAKGVY